MKGPSLKFLIIVTVCLAIAAGCATPVAAPEPPTPLAPEGMDVVRAWADAIYRGDVDAALSYFTDDGAYLLSYPARGKEEMRWEFNRLAGLETKQENFDCQPLDDKLSCTYTFLDGCMAASGAKGLPVKATFTFQDGKIKEAAAYTVPSPEWDSYWKFVSTVGSWESVFRREQSAKAAEGTKEAGAIRIAICRDYANAVKTQAPATEAAAHAWMEAINSGDLDAALARLTDDASFLFWNDRTTGKEQLSAMFAWLAGRETQYRITDCEWQGAGTQCALSVVDGCIAASGAPDGLSGKMTFESLEDGTLTSVVGAQVVGTNAYRTWLDAEHAWAAAERADELAQAEGYSKEAGAMAVKLCREYAAAQK